MDYGIGNLRSAEKALQYVGAAARLTSDPQEARKADAVVLPGVGSFGPCARALRRSRLDVVAREFVDAQRPFLGICVGLQLLFEGSAEDPEDPGIGVLPGFVSRLPPGVKHPQMQWNQLRGVLGRPSALLASMGPEPWVYFVHSYAPPMGDEAVSTCDYGGEVVAAVERGVLWGVQFHPEKSSDAGLALLKAFTELAR